MYKYTKPLRTSYKVVRSLKKKSRGRGRAPTAASSRSQHLGTGGRWPVQLLCSPLQRRHHPGDRLRAAGPPTQPLPPPAGSPPALTTPQRTQQLRSADGGTASSPAAGGPRRAAAPAPVPRLGSESAQVRQRLQPVGTVAAGRALHAAQPLGAFSHQPLVHRGSRLRRLLLLILLVVVAVPVVEQRNLQQGAHVASARPGAAPGRGRSAAGGGRGLSPLSLQAAALQHPDGLRRQAQREAQRRLAGRPAEALAGAAARPRAAPRLRRGGLGPRPPLGRRPPRRLPLQGGAGPGAGEGAGALRGRPPRLPRRLVLRGPRRCLLGGGRHRLLGLRPGGTGGSSGRRQDRRQGRGAARSSLRLLAAGPGRRGTRSGQGGASPRGRAGPRGAPRLQPHGQRRTRSPSQRRRQCEVLASSAPRAAVFPPR